MSGIRSQYSDELKFFAGLNPQDLIREFGSPLYVYSEEVLRKCCQDLKNLFRHPSFVVSYSTKANPNPHLLKIIRDEGLHADAMSPGELAMLKKAGFPKEEISYVSNNISKEELSLAGDEASFVSVDSLDQLESFGKVHPGAKVVVRINPGIGAGHHQKVITAGKNTKFGITPDLFGKMKEILNKYNLTLQGLNQHVGSLFLDPKPYLEASTWLLEVAEDFPGIEIIDFGGGFGIPYHKYEHENRLDLTDFSKRFSALLQDFIKKNDYKGKFVIEPGRYTVAECGILLGSVNAVKNNGPVRYVGTDVGFNVLARPAMYESFHEVEIFGAEGAARAPMPQTIVGNICESGDVLVKEYVLPEIHRGDTVAFLDAGAYGHSMSSCYNQRLRTAEVLIQKDGSPKLIRRRDTIEDLLKVYPDL